MSNTNKEVVSTRVQTYTFDNGSLVFSIDHDMIERDLTTSTVDALIGLALKTLIHRSSRRPEGKGEDATVWLLEELEGGEAGGRFRVTSKDRERAASALKSHKMAPEQVAEQFEDLYGIEFQADAEWLAKHYMNVRAKKAAEEKAQQNML